MHIPMGKIAHRGRSRWVRQAKRSLSQSQSARVLLERLIVFSKVVESTPQRFANFGFNLWVGS